MSGSGTAGLRSRRVVSRTNSVRRALLVVGGIAVLTLSAKLNLPLPYVPMTLQTLAVLMIGAVYGPWLGAVTIAGYLAAGAIGLPVFAGPVGGVAVLIGSTAGYLAGFLVGATIVGVLGTRGWHRSVFGAFAVMLIGHAVILAAGFGWLAFGMKLGASKAWLVGVVPFLAGALVKSGLGAGLLTAGRRFGLARDGRLRRFVAESR